MSVVKASAKCRLLILSSLTLRSLNVYIVHFYMYIYISSICEGFDFLLHRKTRWHLQYRNGSAGCGLYSRNQPHTYVVSNSTISCSMKLWKPISRFMMTFEAKFNIGNPVWLYIIVYKHDGVLYILCIEYLCPPPLLSCQPRTEAVFTVGKWSRWHGWDQEIQDFLLIFFYIHEQSSGVEKVWDRGG
jgi:hypothetical protein